MSKLPRCEECVVMQHLPELYARCQGEIGTFACGVVATEALRTTEANAKRLRIRATIVRDFQGLERAEELKRKHNAMAEQYNSLLNTDYTAYPCSPDPDV